mmetsp:Transcript_33608/g.41162  ORF Transcript_33608/g.41162 Transcript_33608/m.41162 type:complete len:163 (-) Transcript_33608:223-711(-)|eukprot:CAMPEP_0172496828 /NCGR_PEP_ID=MMETSP1066-20121228/93710_1 /TAXON_ID=671091 /ORGANISM="Coscinodiscus wailesii, Strain CCMP2513" /LENGTH=162 /DNA_ID=CAMNT_0013269327 /DNA_START=43 /DNA_END=531 /DNA_ORIENTATION=+
MNFTIRAAILPLLFLPVSLCRDNIQTTKSFGNAALEQFQRSESIPIYRSKDVLLRSNGEMNIQDAPLTKISIPRGGGLIPAGYHPFGYALTELGERFLQYDGSLDSDIGRFLASFKSGRKTKKVVKDQWLEVLRVSKTGQSARIYRKLEELISFCVDAGFLS